MTKDAGDFTHYGDQTLILLNTLEANKPFGMMKFKSEWTNRMSKENGYTGYL